MLQCPRGLCSDKHKDLLSSPLKQAATPSTGWSDQPQNLGPGGNCATLNRTRQDGGIRNSARSGGGCEADCPHFLSKTPPRNYQQSPALRFSTQLSAAAIIHYMDKQTQEFICGSLHPPSVAAEPGAVSDQQILTLPPHSRTCSSSKNWEPFTQELEIPPSSPAKSCSFSSAHPKKHKHTHAQTFLFSRNYYLVFSI